VALVGYGWRRPRARAGELAAGDGLTVVNARFAGPIDAAPMRRWPSATSQVMVETRAQRVGSAVLEVLDDASPACCASAPTVRGPRQARAPAGGQWD
jgi:deoxyxylulose-5-phosphate synthase